jgi:hypothetical protein
MLQEIEQRGDSPVFHVRELFPKGLWAERPFQDLLGARSRAAPYVDLGLSHG